MSENTFFVWKEHGYDLISKFAILIFIGFFIKWFTCTFWKTEQNMNARIQVTSEKQSYVNKDRVL